MPAHLLLSDFRLSMPHSNRYGSKYYIIFENKLGTGFGIMCIVHRSNSENS